MNKPNADIELIRKYFNGELSPADQYELEKRALDDPFLQDAMDGFEQFVIQPIAFEELDNRLANRIQKKDKVVALWGFKQWSIAASLIFGIAAISIYLNQTPENKPIAVSEIQKKERFPKSVRILEDTLANKNEIGLLENSSTLAKKDISTSAKAKEFYPADEITIQPLTQLDENRIKDSIMLNEVTVVGYGSQAKKEVVGSISRFNAEEVAKIKTESTLDGRSFENVTLKAKAQNTEQIIGTVTAKEDGLSLPGVQITNKNTGEVVITDGKGEFKIKASENDVVTTKYIGFISESVAINKRDTLTISLQPDQKRLSEVVVTGYGTQQPSNEIFAGPKGGWKAFRKYLDNNASLYYNQKGKVVVQFIIQPDGKLTSFVIQKGLNIVANNKAIDLIKSYPSWIGSTNGKAQKALVAVRFK